MKLIPTYLSLPMKNYLNKKILITGGQGQLGNALVHHPFAKTFSIYAASRDEMNITQLNSIENAIKKYMPDIVIHAAAYTAVDQAENNIETVMQINSEGSKNIAIACHKHQIPLIHISTDYIFNGAQNMAYAENATPQPLNIYGKSK